MKSHQFVTFSVADQLLGIQVENVQEVIQTGPVTPVPLTDRALSGLLNLRGQIVTVLDLRERLGLGRNAADAGAKGESMSIVVKVDEELFSLRVDHVGEVMTLDEDISVSVPSTLDETWKIYCESVYQLKRGLLVIVNVSRLIDVKIGNKNKKGRSHDQ